MAAVGAAGLAEKVRIVEETLERRQHLCRARKNGIAPTYGWRRLMLEGAVAGSEDDERGLARAAHQPKDGSRS